MPHSTLKISERIASHTKALTADELADIMNIDRVTVYRQAKEGILPSFRIGTCVRFCPRTVSEWLGKQ